MFFVVLFLPASVKFNGKFYESLPVFVRQMNDFTLFGCFGDYFLYSFHIVIASYQQPRKSQALHSGHLIGERVPINGFDCPDFSVANPLLEHPLAEHVVVRRSGHQVFGPLVVANGDDDTEASIR